MKVWRKVAYGVLAGLILAGVKFTQNLIINNGVFMTHYEAGYYDAEDLSALGFLNIQEPYVLYYNLGNVAYQNGKYGEAVQEYERALEVGVPEARVCDVRVNLALADLALVNWDVKSLDDVNALSEELKKVVAVLEGNGCANANDTGSSEAAEELEAEVEEIQEAISGSGEGEEGDEESEEEKQEGDENPKDKKEEELNERSEAANSQKNANAALYEWFDAEEFYHGTRW